MFAADPRHVRIRRRFSGDAGRPLGSSDRDHEHLLQQTRARRDPGGIEQERGTLAPTHAAGRFSLHASTGVSVNMSDRSCASSVDLLSAVPPGDARVRIAGGSCGRGRGRSRTQSSRQITERLLQ